VDHLVLAQVEHHEVAVDRRAREQLRLGGARVRAVERHALDHVGHLEHLLHRQLQAGVDQLHHELVVGDAKVAEAAEPGARVHQEAEQDPACRSGDLIGREQRAVGLVNGFHERLRDPAETLGAAEVVVDDTGGRLGARNDDVVLRSLAQTLGLALVVIESQARAGNIGQVGGDVAIGDLDEPVLHVLRMDELDLVEDPELFQQCGTDQPVEVAAGDEAALLGGMCDHGCSFPLAWSSHKGSAAGQES
jgi:hypothetical protein